MATVDCCPTCGARLEVGGSQETVCAACLLASVLDTEEPIDTSLQPGCSLGAFTIRAVLGKGGMATVYEAFDPSLERTVALKVLPPEFLHDDSFARRFRREARVIARLQHPNIVPIYASGIDNGTPWMSMRLLDGGSLGDVLDRSPLAVSRSLEILRRVAAALDYAHGEGVVHRDIKPTNILMDRGGDHVCVADFGLAYINDLNLAVSNSISIAGTPHYMAPEQALGHRVDRRADIYSLGVLAYEMLSGTLPFLGDSPIAIVLKHLNAPPPSHDALGPALLGAIHKALAKAPAERWESAGSFVAALESGLLETRRSAAWARVSAAARRHQRAVAIGGLAVVVSAGTLIVARGGSEEGPAAIAEAQPVTRGDLSLSPVDAQQAPPTSLSTGSTPLPPPRGRVSSQGAPGQLAPPSAPAADASPASPSSTVNQVVVDAVQSDASRHTDATTITLGAMAEHWRLLPAIPHQPPSVPPSDIVVPPSRTRTVSAEYPAVARAAHIAGDVALRAVIAADGKVSAVTVLRAIHPLLDEAARRAVLQYEYLPGRRNGVAERMTTDITVSFRLQ